MRAVNGLPRFREIPELLADIETISHMLKADVPRNLTIPGTDPGFARLNLRAPKSKLPPDIHSLAIE